MKLVLGLLSFAVINSFAFAGICEINVTRVACPGKETESYVKCGGKESCTSKKKADNMEACTKLAADECANSRLDITKSKTITATYEGKTSENQCKADRPDFNKCK